MQTVCGRTDGVMWVRVWMFGFPWGDQISREGDWEALTLKRWQSLMYVPNPLGRLLADTFDHFTTGFSVVKRSVTSNGTVACRRPEPTTVIMTSNSKCRSRARGLRHISQSAQRIALEPTGLPVVNTAVIPNRTVAWRRPKPPKHDLLFARL